MPARFLAFFAVVTTLMLAIHGYLGWRLIMPAGLQGRSLVAAWGVVVVVALLQPATLMGRFFLRSPWSERLQWVGYLAMGCFSVVLTLTVFRDVTWVLMGAASTLPPDDDVRRVWLHHSNVGLLALSGGLVGWGVYQARRRARIVDVEVPIADLPDALVGFTIAQISDVHIGPTIRRDTIEDVVQTVNSIDADIVAITGDLVDGKVSELREHAAPLQQLHARDGVFFVTGNHEYYAGAPQWIAHLGTLGIRPLMNEHVVLTRGPGRARVVVAGVTDYNAGQIVKEHASDPVAAFAGAPTDAVRLLLAHQPRSAFAASKVGGVHLQLSGHTHGGQLFPWMFLVPVQQPLVAGLQRFADMLVYTSRGTGYWGPPLRIGAPSEVTRLRLVRAA